jgi:hypothetical protein
MQCWEENGQEQEEEQEEEVEELEELEEDRNSLSLSLKFGKKVERKKKQVHT